MQDKPKRHSALELRKVLTWLIKSHWNENVVWEGHFFSVGVNGEMAIC